MTEVRVGDVRYNKSTVYINKQSARYIVKEKMQPGWWIVICNESDNELQLPDGHLRSLSLLRHYDTWQEAVFKEFNDNDNI